MQLNTAQVAEKLGISRSRVLSMTKRGELVPSNTPKDNAKKFFPRFDSKYISEYLKQHGKPNGRRRRVSDTPLPFENGMPSEAPQRVTQGPSGIVTRLEAVEHKLDLVLAAVQQLHALWS